MLYLMSTTVIPAGANGDWNITPITLGCAQDIVRKHHYTSAVGHASTAEAMAELLEQKCEAARITVTPVEGDYFLCFRLLKRPPEGAILDKQALHDIGFEWVLMTFLEEGFTRPLDSYTLSA
jgi:hypothetical protein